MLLRLWLLDALHWDNWGSLTIFCWLPSSNPHCESWSRSISSLTAGLGKSLLNSRKLRFAMPSAVPVWAIPVDGPVLIQPVAPLWLSDKPDWRLRQQLHSTSLGFREISNMLIYIPKNSLYFYLRKRWRKKPKQQTIPHILILVFFTENKNDRNVHVTLITTPVSHMPA